MIRSLGAGFAVALILTVGAPVVAQPTKAAAGDSGKPSAKHKAEHKADKSAKTAKAKAKSKTAKNAAKEAAKGKEESKSETGGEAGGKPEQIATFGDWGAFLAEGKEKTCYVLAQPKERAPAKLKRDPAYVFISSRPGENIHNEISIMMGFRMKDGGDAEADVGGTSFDLVSKGSDAWIKNPAQEAEFISAMKKNAKLVVKANSLKGNTTTDSYSLAGLVQALQRADKECR